jgi:Topoisomerase VI B subunit, transducer
VLCCTGDARVLEGHSFLVEAAVSLGGKDIRPGINIYRFANRIPLLFEVRRILLLFEARCACCSSDNGAVALLVGGTAATRVPLSSGRRNSCARTRLVRRARQSSLVRGAAQGGSDVITKTALKRINWSSYKINQSQDKVGVFVSIVSTRIPFKGAGKEYIGEHPVRSCLAAPQGPAKGGILGSLLQPCGCPETMPCPTCLCRVVPCIQHEVASWHNIELSCAIATSFSGTQHVPSCFRCIVTSLGGPF